MKTRLEAIREVLAGNGLDGIMVTYQQNWQYLSGFTGSNAVLIITAGDSHLITDFRYIDQASKEAAGYEVIKPGALVEDAVAEDIARLGIKRLGFEDRHLTYREYAKYGEKLAGVEMVPLDEALEKLRWVKDKSEIDALREAARITDETFDHILDFIRPGVREAEIALEMDYYMRRRGAQKSAFDIIVASGPRGALPHGVASDRVIGPGELVVMDFGAVFAGYHADMTRTIITGRPDHKQQEIYNLVLQAQEKALKAVRPGVRCSDVDIAARDLITSAGYGSNFGHGLGHSVGLEIHEKPSFAPKDNTVLEAGMVLTVEPGVYLSNWGGVRIEDLILVTAGGCEILSRSPKDLISL